MYKNVWTPRRRARVNLTCEVDRVRDESLLPNLNYVHVSLSQNAIKRDGRETDRFRKGDAIRSNGNWNIEILTVA